MFSSKAKKEYNAGYSTEVLANVSAKVFQDVQMSIADLSTAMRESNVQPNLRNTSNDLRYRIQQFSDHYGGVNIGYQKKEGLGSKIKRKFSRKEKFDENEEAYMDYGYEHGRKSTRKQSAEVGTSYVVGPDGMVTKTMTGAAATGFVIAPDGRVSETKIGGQEQTLGKNRVTNYDIVSQPPTYKRSRSLGERIKGTFRNPDKDEMNTSYVVGADGYISKSSVTQPVEGRPVIPMLPTTTTTYGLGTSLPAMNQKEVEAERYRDAAIRQIIYSDVNSGPQEYIVTPQGLLMRRAQSLSPRRDYLSRSNLGFTTAPYTNQVGGYTRESKLNQSLGNILNTRGTMPMDQSLQQPRALPGVSQNIAQTQALNRSFTEGDRGLSPIPRVMETQPFSARSSIVPTSRADLGVQPISQSAVYDHPAATSTQNLAQSLPPTQTITQGPTIMTNQPTTTTVTQPMTTISNQVITPSSYIQRPYLSSSIDTRPKQNSLAGILNNPAYKSTILPQQNIPGTSMTGQAMSQLTGKPMGQQTDQPLGTSTQGMGSSFGGASQQLRSDQAIQTGQFASQQMPREQFMSQQMPREQFISQQMPREQFMSQQIPREQFASQQMPREQQFVSQQIPREQQFVSQQQQQTTSQLQQSTSQQQQQSKLDRSYMSEPPINQLPIQQPTNLGQVRAFSEDRIPYSEHDESHNYPHEYTSKTQSGYAKFSTPAGPIVEETGTPQRMSYSTPIQNILPHRVVTPQMATEERPEGFVVYNYVRGFPAKSMQQNVDVSNIPATNTYDNDRVKDEFEAVQTSRELAAHTEGDMRRLEEQGGDQVAEQLRPDEGVRDMGESQGRGKDKVESQLRDILKNIVDVIGTREGTAQEGSISARQDRRSEFDSRVSQGFSTENPNRESVGYNPDAYNMSQNP